MPSNLHIVSRRYCFQNNKQQEGEIEDWTVSTLQAAWKGTIEGYYTNYSQMDYGAMMITSHYDCLLL